MVKKLAKIGITIAGIAAGVGICAGVLAILNSTALKPSINLPQWAILLIYVASGLLFGIIFFILSSVLIRGVRKLEKRIASLSLGEVVTGVVGLIVGLLISFLLTGLFSGIEFSNFGWIKVPINILIYIMFAWLGVTVALGRRNEININKLFRRGGHSKPEDVGSRSLILDTSVIIDGRIYDICKTGIIDGTLVIPEFVLVELRHIADSSDDLKRSRGRRGLDVLNMIQKDLNKAVKILHTDYDDNMEVDSKLLKLARETNGKIVTNDFNLNKVATVQGVEVININDLANAVKPIALPGETMEVHIIKDGKEPTQGIAYLDDGTMIVVEDGKGKVGKTMKVMVTSVLQTSAGRMIFARIAE